MRARVACDLIADDRPRSGHEVEDALWQIRFDDALRERNRGDRRRGGRRPDNGVPDASAGAINSAGIVYGQFQGRDHADHAARPADEQHALARGERVSEPALEPLAVLGGIAPVLDQLLDLVARLLQRLALVERQRVRELVANASRPRRRPGALPRRDRTQ